MVYVYQSGFSRFARDLWGRSVGCGVCDEATVHALNLKDGYSVIANVLKAGGAFGLSEWVMTPGFDEEN